MSTNTPDMHLANSSAPNHELAQVLVPPAMLILAVALGVAGHLHLGLSAEIATAVGVALFSLMLMCHVLLRVADAAERAADEAAERAMTQVTSPMPAAAAAAELHKSLDPTLSKAAENGEPGRDPVMSVADAAQANEVLARPAVWSMSPIDLQRPRTMGMGAAKGSDTGQLTDFGSLRPTSVAHTLPELPQMVTTPPSNQGEVDRVEALLLRLARQIREGVDAGRSPRQQMEPALRDATGASEHTLHSDVVTPDVALSSAVDALRSTAEAMRGPSASAPGVSAVELRIAAVAEAIAHERADVFLSPILGLADDSARHFEVSVQLRLDDGEARATAMGAGLLPLLDALNVRHAAGFALVLERRGRDGAVFSSIGGSSLESERFVSDVSGKHAQGIAERMVLAFAQDEMRGLGSAQIAALGDLGRLGFRFSLHGIADLDMDFEALQALGFQFVKLDAPVFAAGLVCSGEHVPASDICRYFEELGLEVIVGGIGDAAMRDLMVSCGVGYGQGPLFGAARPVPVTSAASPIAA